MIISGVNNYSMYGMRLQTSSGMAGSGSTNNSAAGNVTLVSVANGAATQNGMQGVADLPLSSGMVMGEGADVQMNDDGDTYTKVNKNDPNYECQTCKNRKYQDGSDEMVSFKSPAHVSPQAAGSAVRAHEQEHVANAYDEANRENGEVIQASVQIHTAICPECGRSYVAGGETNTQIKYTNEKNPYQKDLAAKDATKYSGMNVSASA